MARGEFRVYEKWADDRIISGSVPIFLYCIVEQAAENGPCKVGIASNLAKRLSSLQCGNWRRLAFAWTIELASRFDALAAEEDCLSFLRPSIYSTDDRALLASEWVDSPPDKVLSVALRRLNVEEEHVRRISP